MAEIYPNFVAFIEGLVLPLVNERPNFARLDGRSAGEPGPPTRPKRAAIIIHNGQKFGVDDDSIIENLLAPYRAWKAGEVEYPIVVGETRNRRPMLVPAVGAGTKTGFFIYLQGSPKNEIPSSITISIETDGAISPGLGEIDALVMEAYERIKRDAAFRERIFRRWGTQCALTGCEDLAVLEAAHIDPHAKTGDNRASNGLPLRSDVHRLLDRGLLTLAIIGRMLIVKVDPSVRFPEYRALHGKQIELKK